MSRDAVEEEAVVRDDDDAAGELEQRLLEGAHRVDVCHMHKYTVTRAWMSIDDERG